jgi:hypothetical protein
MLTFVIYLNGQKLCALGLHDGVMTAGVQFVSEDAHKKRPRELTLSTGGLSSDGVNDHHFGWYPRHLAVGDEVLIRVTDAAEVDVPEYQERRQSPEELQREYKQRMLALLKEELEGTVAEVRPQGANPDAPHGDDS